MSSIFKVKRYSQLEILVVVFFSLEYFREALLYIHPFLINAISLFISFLIIYCLKFRIYQKVRMFFFTLIGFIFIALIKGNAIGFFDSRTLIYSVFKSIEILAIVVLLSNVRLSVFLNILTLLIKVFIVVNLILLLYYFGALIGLLPSINRIVIFDYRFAGLSGEPAQFAQHCVFILFSILIVMKHNRLESPRLCFAIILLMAIISFSNSIILLAFFLLVFYFLFIGNGNGNVIRKILLILSLIPVLYIAITKVFTRLDIDVDTLTSILGKFSSLTESPITSYSELSGSNGVTIRFFEFIYSLSMINQPIGNGFGSTVLYARYAGYIPEDSYINMYGITQVGFELGFIPMFLFGFFLLWTLLIMPVALSKDIRFLIASIFFMIFIMNGFGFKIVWFFLFVVLIHKDWFLKNRY